MRSPVFACILGLSLLAVFETWAAASDWLSAPKPNFPTSALRKGVEVSVRLRLLLANDGSVISATVSKSSGDPVLDQAAQSSVLKWRMKPSAVKPSDLIKGRTEEIEFRQEAILAAAYPDRKAYFNSWEHTDIWMFAPFPSYPYDQRRLHHTGRVVLSGRVADDGHVTDVKVSQSSGYRALDQCAVTALHLWRAHKKYAGFQFEVPIEFKIGR